MAKTPLCGRSQPVSGQSSKPLMNHLKKIAMALVVLLFFAASLHAGDADLAIPDLDTHGKFTIFGQEVTAGQLLFYGSFVIAGTLGISLYLRAQIKRVPAHKSMLDVAEVIFQTCKTYLIQQGKFLLMLFAIIACAMTYYFLGLKLEFGGSAIRTVLLVLLFSVVGMGGS